jgi:hypothetical protein
VAQIREDGHVVVDPVMGMGFETASRSFKEGPVVPGPEHLVGVLSCAGRLPDIEIDIPKSTAM